MGRNALSAFDEAIRSASRATGPMQSDGTQSRPLLTPAIVDEEVQRDILNLALAKVQPRVLSFEEQVSPAFPTSV